MALWDNFGLGDLPKGWAGDVTSAYATQLQYSYFLLHILFHSTFMYTNMS